MTVRHSRQHMCQPRLQGMTYITTAWLWIQTAALAAFLLRDSMGAMSAAASNPSMAQALVLAAYAPIAILQVL